MKWIWDKKRIEYNFRQDIEPKYKKHIQQRSHSLKVYITGPGPKKLGVQVPKDGKI